MNQHIIAMIDNPDWICRGFFKHHGENYPEYLRDYIESDKS